MDNAEREENAKQLAASVNRILGGTGLQYTDTEESMPPTREELLTLLHEGSTVMFHLTDVFAVFVKQVGSEEHTLIMQADAWVDKVNHVV